MKNYIKNVVLVMSGGSGTRFGADKPKQYCDMKGRPVIEYVLEACKLSTRTDQVVIVTAQDYVDSVREQYGYPTTVGGVNRTESLYNGLQYVSAHYACEKVIVINAVCPLVVESQIDRYFDLLDDYDYVLTCWKITSTLHRYDGQMVDRNDYFHVMEPEGYNFKKLHTNYKVDYPVPYVFHQMPKDSKPYYCFDYPYTMKLTYARDLKIVELLYNDIIEKPRRDKTMHKMNMWLSSFKSEGVEKIYEWSGQIPAMMEELSQRWEIMNYSLNPQAFATCVYEAYSRKYGSVVVKFHSPTGRFQPELAYYKNAKGGFMADLLDYDKDYRAMLIRKILPGSQVKYHVENPDFYAFYKKVSDNFLDVPEGLSGLPTIMSEFNMNVENASNYTYEHDFRQRLEKMAYDIYDKYFADSKQYFLHRDLHRRNLMQSVNGIVAIDPLGCVGPKEFEYTIEVIIETRQSKDPIKCYKQLFSLFSQFVDPERLAAALFFIYVHKMDEYVFVKHDHYEMASWALDMIKKLYFTKEELPYGKEEEHLDIMKYTKNL